MSNVAINIAAEFTGKPAFKKAETSVDRLEKRTKNLGRTLTRTFGTAAIAAFARSSVKAFAEDDKAATALGTTLKNLNLAYGSNIGTVNGYISRLEAQTGVLDDELRPAMDRLLRATGDVAKSQELLNLALDVAAGTGKSVTQVSQSLQKAYLGQTQALGRLGVGLSKAELTSSSFEEIQKRLTTLFAGQASAAADTFAGQLDKLTIAANNAKETIGKGLYDAITALSGGGATAATDNIDKLAKGIADSLKNVGLLIDKLEKLKPVLIAVGVVAAAAFLPLTTAIAGAIFLLGDLNKRLDEQSFRKGIIPGGMGNIAMSVSSQDTQKADAAAKKNATAITKLTKEQAAAQAKITKDKKLQAAIDKANLALGKGSDVFDLDKIQVAAALTNQAEQLGKATNSAQLLQITNDTARLNVKRSILALEDALASKDEAAIKAATNKLNADLGILGTLMKQELKMQDIKSILESLKPKDLINLGNLDAAIAKMIELNKLQGSKTGTTPTAATATDGASVYTIPKNTTDFTIANPDIYKLVDNTVRFASDSVTEQFYKAVNDIADLPSAVRGANYQARAEQEYAAFLSQINLEGIAGASLTSGMAQGLPLANALSGSRYAAQGAASYGSGATIVVNTGVGDPNAIAEAIDNVLREARDRGTLTAL